MFSQINLITTDHRNKLQTSTVAACIDIKINSKTSDCRQYDPPPCVITATRKVTPSSELAPKGPSPAPVLLNPQHRLAKRKSLRVTTTDEDFVYYCTCIYPMSMLVIDWFLQ